MHCETARSAPQGANAASRCSPGSIALSPGPRWLVVARWTQRPAQPLVKTLRSSEHERYGEQGQHARQKDQQDLYPPVHSSQPVHLVLIHAEEGAYEDVPLVVELTADAVPYGLTSGLCLLALFTVARRSREQVGPPRRSVATGTGVPRAP